MAAALTDRKQRQTRTWQATQKHARHRHCLIFGARSRNRTGTEVSLRGILSPLRLPISPPGLDSSGIQVADKYIKWRLGSESNRRPRLCRPLHNHSATQPAIKKFGAGNETRTRDLNLGKVALYQLSYSRFLRGVRRLHIVRE